MNAYRATRGVCIGVDRHLKAGDPVPSDLDAGQITFLRGIGAIQLVPEPPSAPADQTEQKAMDLESKATPDEGGKKKR